MQKSIYIFIFMLFSFAAAADFKGYLLDADWWKNATFEQIEQQIKMSPNINKTDDSGRTALMYALVFKQPLEVIDILLQKGTKVQKESDDGNTPLVYALSHKASPEVIDLLLRHGADVNAPDSRGRSPLYLAIGHGYAPEMIEKLIQKGAEVNDCCTIDGKFRQSILAMTIKNAKFVAENLLKTTEILLQNGAEVNHTENGTTPLILAVDEQTPPEMIDLLIKYGADVNMQDMRGNTPLMRAIRMQNPVHTAQLLEHGADVAADAGEQISLLCYALKYGALTETIQYLLDLGAEVQPADQSENIPLICAATHPNKPKVIELLLAHGADVNATDASGRTALMGVSSAAVADVLIKHGIDVNARDKNGSSALMYVKRADVAELLLQYGAEVNVQNEFGETPLIRAIMNKAEPKAVETLLVAGADVKATDKKGLSAADYAERYYPAITELLTQYGAY